MEAIILGNPYDIVQGAVTPIEIPAYEAEKAVIKLSDGYNPYVVSGTSGGASQYWFRYDTGILNPLTISDKVVIGGTTVLESESFRVVGKANLGSIQLGSSVVISDILDEDDMISDSDVALATQQSIKAYVDSQFAGSIQAGDNISLLTNDSGYITTETDPIFSSSAAFGIINTDISNWNTSYSWGDHSIVGYITSESDPVFTGSVAYSIANTDITNWNDSYSWGNHATVGYLTVETDPIFIASAASSILISDITNWNTAYDQSHTHSNFALLETLTDSGDGLSVLHNDGVYKPLVSGLDTYIQYNVAGLLSSDSDFTFNPTTSTLSTPNTVVTNTLYIGDNNLSIYKDITGSMMFQDELNSPVSLSDLIGGSSVFQSPDGYTTTTSTVGGISSGTAVAELNGNTYLEIFHKMLFPTPLSPNFVNPTESMTITIGTAANFNGTYVIKGSSSAMTIVNSFNTINGPGLKPYALVNGSPSYTVNTAAFSNGDTVVFSGTTYQFKVDQIFKANGEGEVDPEFVVLSNGDTVYANEYTGYSPGTVSSSITYTAVDPVYYGSFTAGTSTYNTVPTWAEIQAGCNKLISVEPNNISVNITTYSGTVNTHKYIVIAYPDSYGLLNRILYQEGGNNDVIGSFLNTTSTYTRPDTTTVTYRVYYALNSYAGETTPRTLHYTVYF